MVVRESWRVILSSAIKATVVWAGLNLGRLGFLFAIWVFSRWPELRSA